MEIVVKKYYHLVRRIAATLFFLAPLLFPSCVTTYRLPIETLQPARISFDFPKRTIGINASQTLWAESAMMSEGANADSLIRNILFSLQYFLETMSGYENAIFSVFATKNDSQHQYSDFDMFIELDRLQINNTYYGQQHNILDWEAFLHAHYTARWYIRNSSGDVVNEYIDRDLMIWRSGIHASRDMAVENLPSVRDAWWDVGIALAERYAARISPQWQRGIRTLYVIDKFYDLSQLALTAMRNDAYMRAFDIWDNMLMACRKNGEKKIKSRITYNMAVAFEFQNQLEEAVYWAERSVSLKPDNRNETYLRMLRERQRHKELLDAQLKDF